MPDRQHSGYQLQSAASYGPYAIIATMLSFIVPAHNEERLVGTTIEAIHAAAQASGEAWEVIVVDDACTDRTADIATQRGAQVVRVAHRHIAATRNAGARHASGGVLVFVDADTRVDARVLAAARAALRGGAVGGGATVRLSGDTALHERMAAWLLVRLLRMGRVAPGCFVFCTRAAFDAVGGFDEAWFAGEDVAISRALAAHGRFVVLREPVWTSGRKLRTFSLAEHLRLAWRFAWRGRALLRSRSGLDLWYGERRDDSH